MTTLRRFLGFAVLASGCTSSTPDKLDPAWTQIASPTTQTLRDIAISGDQGWICGDHGTLLHSIDAGVTWKAVDTGTTADLYGFGSLSGGTPLRDYLYVVGDQGTILLSKDDGKTWVRKHTGSEALRSIGIFDSETGDGVDHLVFAAAGTAGGDAVLLRSRDELETWTSTAVARGVSVNGAYVQFGEGWIAGDHGALYQTEDAGDTWSKVSIAEGITADLHQVEGIGPRVVGDGLVIDHTVKDQVSFWSVTGSSKLPDLAASAFDDAIGNGANGHAVYVHFKNLGNNDFEVDDLGITRQMTGIAITVAAVTAVGEGGTILTRATPAK